MSQPIEACACVWGRREFIHSTITAGGGLALAFSWPVGQLTAEKNMTAARWPSAFLEIGTDNTITVTSPAVEMGQGGHTAMPMILIEELGGDWNRVTVKDAKCCCRRLRPTGPCRPAN